MSLADTYIPGATANGPGTDHNKGPSRPNVWRHEWSHSSDLQHNYSSADSYAADRARQERARADAEASSQSESDRANEAILAKNEREGRLHGGQASELAEVRARQGASTSAAQPAAPRVAAASPPMTEAQRVAAIDALGLPGCENLLAELKADKAVTPDAAAVRITAEYRRLRHEANGREIAARFHRGREPATVVELGAPPPALMPARGDPKASGGPVNLIELRQRAETEWEASIQLQREFATAAVYSNYRVGVATGRVRVFREPGSAA